MYKVPREIREEVQGDVQVLKCAHLRCIPRSHPAVQPYPRLLHPPISKTPPNLLLTPPVCCHATAACLQACISTLKLYLLLTPPVCCHTIAACLGLAYPSAGYRTPPYCAGKKEQVMRDLFMCLTHKIVLEGCLIE